VVFAQDMKFFENTDARFEYPSSWNIIDVNTETSEIDSAADFRILGGLEPSSKIFIAPVGWNQDIGGMVASYLVINFGSRVPSCDTWTEQDVSAFIDACVESSQDALQSEGIDDPIKLVSSKIITVGNNYSALDFELTLHTKFLQKENFLQKDFIDVNQRFVVIGDGKKMHVFTFQAESSEYSVSMPIFDGILNSFRIQSRSEGRAIYVTLILVTIGVLAVLSLVGIIKMTRTRTKKNHLRISGDLKTCIRIGKYAVGVLWFISISSIINIFDLKLCSEIILLPILLLSLLVLLISTLPLINTEERELAKSRLISAIIFLIGSIIYSWFALISLS
jgi:hypothetical protein